MVGWFICPKEKKKKMLHKITVVESLETVGCCEDQKHVFSINMCVCVYIWFGYYILNMWWHSFFFWFVLFLFIKVFKEYGEEYHSEKSFFFFFSSWKSLEKFVSCSRSVFIHLKLPLTSNHLREKKGSKFICLTFSYKV